MSHADNSTFTAAERLREQTIGRRKYREALDRAAAVTISLGGIGILATLVLLLVYLIYVVRPLFVPAEISSVVSFSAAPSQAAQAARLPPVLLSMDERTETVLRLDQSGQFSWIDLGSESIVLTSRLSVARSAEISAVALLSGEPALMAIGLNSGEVFLVSAEYGAAAGPESGARNLPRRLSYPLVVCRC